MPSPSLRPYRPETDFNAVAELWETSLGHVWPISSPSLALILTDQPDYRDGDHFVCERDGTPVGFAATQVRRTAATPSPQGGIALVMVHPDHRRQGIGTALHDRALDHLRESGMRRVQLGAGTSSRFWNGVPANLPYALAFFRSTGWDFTGTSYDLTRSLHDYVTPNGVFERIEKADISLRTPRPGEVARILEFECREFPNWHPYFREAAQVDAHEDILVAWDERGEVVGTLLTFSRSSPGVERDRLWTTLLGEEMGGLGAVGVAETMRERGIGLALVAKATELLRDRGVGNSHIGWTWLLDFYGRVGYRSWRTYSMSWRDL